VRIDQIDRAPAYQALADHLRGQIASGVLRPGDRLPTEPQLSARTGLSRSTVREALRLLASQNLIVTTRGVTGGSFVAQPTPAQLGDLLSTGMQLLMTSGTVSIEQWLELRHTFEVPAAGLAAQRRTEADVTRLTETLLDPDRTPLSVLVPAHRTFHLVVAAATGNPLYELITGPLYAPANEQAVGDCAPAGFWQQVNVDHRAILHAISAGDPATARAAARRHLTHMGCAYAGSDLRVTIA
jgi:GntR family transcriptional regulator, transcriptional repressor for pyruvate dehydrogenase complex